jgi:hypothetical protein
MGHLREGRDQRAALPAATVGRQDYRVAQLCVARLSAPHASRRRADRERVSLRHQYAPGSPRAGNVVQRCGGQGHGEPDLAQGKERATPGTPARSWTSRSCGSLSTAPWFAVGLIARPPPSRCWSSSPRRARRRPEGVACDQQHRRAEHRSLARDSSFRQPTCAQYKPRGKLP